MASPFLSLRVGDDSVKCLQDLVASQPVPVVSPPGNCQERVEVVARDFNQTIESIWCREELLKKKPRSVY